MKQRLWIFICCLGSLSLHSQNLILNSSFEQHLQPYCEGWYNACWKELSCDTLGDCSTFIYEDSPGDSLADQWCLLIYGNMWPFENHVDYYVTGRTGTYVYQMKFWMNTMHFVGSGRLGVLDHGVFVQKDSIEDLLQPWTEYIIEDTITTIAADTIVVRLSPAIGDFCLCDVYYDLVELNVLDSLSTAVVPVSKQEEIFLFPNPVRDKLQVVANTLSPFVIMILNSQGQIVLEQAYNDGKTNLDAAGIPPGIYFYSITELKNQKILKSGKLLKL